MQFKKLHEWFRGLTIAFKQSHLELLLLKIQFVNIKKVIYVEAGLYDGKTTGVVESYKFCV